MKQHHIPQVLALSLTWILLSSLCWLVLTLSPQAAEAKEPIEPLPDVTFDPAKVELGKRLFYDKRLSRDNSVSCASCHDLSTGGVDRQQFSTGIGGAQGSINAPTVLNSGFNFVQHWNGRVSSLEDQIDIPVKGKRGMASNWPEIISKLSQDKDYPRLFTALYPDGIQSTNIKDAIATFERSLATPSRFDRYLQGNANAITADEKKGYALFKSYGCIACHQGANVGGNMFQRFGVMGNYFEDRGRITKADYGRYNITGREEDRFVFRVPSLRNVAITPPYFHDGSANTLEAAVGVMAKYQLGAILPDADRDLI
ncbi:MAG: cytochrome B6, partial [Candidatus Tectomicrobia bacterium]|nr:cytochrome B6 [Candidatus Tectomicrobia bacterium]